MLMILLHNCKRKIHHKFLSLNEFYSSINQNEHRRGKENSKPLKYPKLPNHHNRGFHHSYKLKPYFYISKQQQQFNLLKL